MAIHHATVKRAAKHGLTIIEADGQFRLCQIADGLLSVETYDNTAEALEEFERGECEFETEEEAEESFGACGVMAKNYHDIYSSNPHGPGCGDSVDTNLRDACVFLHDGEKEPRLDLPTLKAIGTDAGLWKAVWEGLNPGMQRMNLANRIRGLLRNNDKAKVRIGKTTGRFGVAARTPKAKPAKVAKAA